MKTIRVLLVENHDLVRAGIRALLEQLRGIEVVAEAGEGGEGLRLAHAHRPDVVLMDIMMPGMSGLEATSRLTKECPNVRVLILSMHTGEEYVVQALRLGAAGYLVKSARPAELELAIQAVARGEMYLSPQVSKPVLKNYLERVSAQTLSPLEQLTPRQREILQLVAEGGTTKEIAHKLRLSVKTVEMHRAQLMKRLDIHEVAGLVRYAIRVGLVAPEE